MSMVKRTRLPKSVSKKREHRINRMFDDLYKVTSKQDVLNIGIMKAIDDDTDPRWKVVHMIDNANAVILGASRNKGDPDAIVSEGYVGDKIDSLNAKWMNIRWGVKRK